MTGQVAAPPAGRRRGVLLNFLALSASAWAGQILNFLTGVYLAGVLGADAFGLIVLAQGVVLYFRLASDLGFDMLGARRMASRPARAADTASAFAGSRLMNAAIAWVGLLVVAAVLQAFRPIGWLVAAFGLLLAPVALSLEWAFSGLERMDVVGGSRLLAAGAWFALVVGLVRTPDAVMVVPLANVAAMSVGALWLFGLFRRRYGVVVLDFRADRWAALVREAAPIGLSLLLIQVYVGFGVVALGLVEGERAAGLYGAPRNVVLFLAAIASMFGAALYPRLSALHEEGREAFERRMTLAFRGMILIGPPLGVGGALVAPSLIAAIYPTDYAPGAEVFRWLALSLIPVFASIPFGCALLAAGRQRAYLLAAAAGAAVNVAATLALIPYLHLRGPAVATLITEALVLAILFVQSRSVGRVHAGRAVLAVTVSTAAMAAGLVVLHPSSLPAQVLLGAGLYLPSLVATGGVTRSDVDWLREWGLALLGRRAGPDS